MATGPETSRRLAFITGETLKVSAVSKVLKQQNPPMAARSIQGGGDKSEHSEPYHLVNIMLGSAIADPVSDAPAAVNRYRALVIAEQQVSETFGPPDARISRVLTEPVDDGTLERLLRFSGPTLGARLDALVTVLQLPANQNLRKLLRDSGFTLRLTVDHEPQASVTFSLKMTDDNDTDRCETSKYLSPQGMLPISSTPKPPAQLRREVVIPFALIDALVDLWDDTLSHRARRAAEAETIPATPMVDPENETAATLPQVTAAIDQDNARPRSSTARTLRVRERKLKRPSRNPGDDHHHRSDHALESRCCIHFNDAGS